MVHDSARSPTNFVPVLSLGSTRISVLYWGAPGWSIANVSSWWPSKLGGSAATTKISSPPARGLSWPEAGTARASRKDVSSANKRPTRGLIWLASEAKAKWSVRYHALDSPAAGRHPARLEEQMANVLTV